MWWPVNAMIIYLMHLYLGESDEFKLNNIVRNDIILFIYVIAKCTYP